MSDKNIELLTFIVLVLTFSYTAIKDFLDRKRIIFDHFSIRQNGAVSASGSEISIELVNSSDYIIGITEVGCKLKDNAIHSNKHQYYTQIHNIEARDSQGYSIPLAKDKKVVKEDIVYIFAKVVGGSKFIFYPNGYWKSFVFKL